ncbi:hypothetical protein NV226_02945 [Mycoplasma iguanae]|uniref:Uncharacterized protein n=1 Tax=Mycoplasma iguanae TaxID=292461 RepID=A0ABY5R8L5_9MOLU|nr:hypothetical protein [Mycoplasma iguanae]UVD81656.1 hypothetical protein NV226_02945 [Mycoplasma iguanae]
MKNKNPEIFDIDIKTDKNQIITFNDAKLFYNLNLEDSWIEIRFKIILSEKQLLLRIDTETEQNFLFAHKAIVINNGKKIIINLQTPLHFYKSSKKEFLIQRKKINLTEIEEKLITFYLDDNSQKNIEQNILFNKILEKKFEAIATNNFYLINKKEGE